MKTSLLILICSAIFFSSCKNDSQEIGASQLPVNEVQSLKEQSPDNLINNDTTVVANIPEINPAVEVNEKVLATSFNKKDYASFGSNFTPSNILNKEQMLKKYKNLKAGDTIAVAFESTINEVCKKKGCWMDVSLGKDQKSFVKFKDYGFFVPLNADKSDAIIRGKAFIDEVSVSELKHYAKDAGKSQEEIDKIISPKVTYAFQADGVLIKR